MGLRDVWESISGRRVQPRTVGGYQPMLPESDAADAHGDEPNGPPHWGVEPISGTTMILHYRDSKGAESRRRVQCKRIEDRGGTVALVAWCYERSATRRFVVARIVEAANMQTGEVYADARSLIEAFRADAVTASSYRYGLAPREYATFNAALNVLAFIARCDQDWHPAEAEVLERFAAQYWLRRELTAVFDEQEIARHSERLAPDDETFYVSLDRCLSEPTVARILRPAIDAVIEADGKFHSRELYFRAKVAEWFAEAGY